MKIGGYDGRPLITTFVGMTMLRHPGESRGPWRRGTVQHLVSEYTLRNYLSELCHFLSSRARTRDPRRSAYVRRSWIPAFAGI